MYVSNEDAGGDIRVASTGDLDDPHQNLFGALASVWRKYTTIKLLKDSYVLYQFHEDAYIESFLNEDKNNPF